MSWYFWYLFWNLHIFASITIMLCERQLDTLCRSQSSEQPWVELARCRISQNMWATKSVKRASVGGVACQGRPIKRWRLCNLALWYAGTPAPVLFFPSSLALNMLLIVLQTLEQPHFSSISEGIPSPLAARFQCILEYSSSRPGDCVGCRITPSSWLSLYQRSSELGLYLLLSLGP